MTKELAPRHVHFTWPDLPLSAWQDTCETLHRWAQIVGKVRLGLTPRINHWWNVALYVSPRGLTTTAIPYEDRWFELELDFVRDVLALRTSDGQERTVALEPRTVASFYADTMAMLRGAGISVRIWPVPVEIPDTTPFDRDEHHRSYDKRYVMRFWRILGAIHDLLGEFRARFLGKSSPVHFFWGTFDLALTRFSGRRAPVPADTNPIEAEAYSHEVSSVGWWPGDARLPRASFYSYASPEPPGFAEARLVTPHAYYHRGLRGYYLHYDDVRAAPDPEGLVLQFAEETYELAATLGRWDRVALERDFARDTAPQTSIEPASM